MRTAVVVGGVVATVVMLPDGSVISEDGKMASAPTSYTVEPFGKPSYTVGYNAVNSAPEGAIFIASNTAGIGWAWSAADGFTEPEMPPPSKDDLIQYATTKQISVVVSGITLTGTATPAALAAVAASINAGIVTTFAQVDIALTHS